MDRTYQLRNYLYSRKEDMIDLLRILVNIDSSSYNKQGVDLLGKLLADRFKRLGCSLKIIEQRDFGNQIIIRTLGTGKGNVLIVTH